MLKPEKFNKVRSEYNKKYGKQSKVFAIVKIGKKAKRGEVLKYLPSTSLSIKGKEYSRGYEIRFRSSIITSLVIPEQVVRICKYELPFSERAVLFFKSLKKWFSHGKK